MKLEFEITEPEYREATTAASNTRSDSYRPLRVAGVIGAAAGFALLFEADRTDWLAPALLVLLGLFLPIYPSLRYRRAVDDGWQTYSTLGPVVWEFSPEGVHFKSALINTYYSWYAFKSFSETPKVFLLYRGGTPAVISKRAFADARQEAEFRSLVKTMLTRPEAAFPVKPL